MQAASLHVNLHSSRLALLFSAHPSLSLAAPARCLAWPQVRTEIGPFAAPDVIHWAPGLPKTRSGKIMRRSEWLCTCCAMLRTCCAMLRHAGLRMRLAWRCKAACQHVPAAAPRALWPRSSLLVLSLCPHAAPSILLLARCCSPAQDCLTPLLLLCAAVLRKIAANKLDELGDTSTLADPAVVQVCAVHSPMHCCLSFTNPAEACNDGKGSDGKCPCSATLIACCAPATFGPPPLAGLDRHAWQVSSCLAQGSSPKRQQR